MLATATALANDDGDDVVAAVQAAQQFGDLLAHAGGAAENNQRPGSYPGKALKEKSRGFLVRETDDLRDYFGLNGQLLMCDEGDFERRFRVPRVVFDRLYGAAQGEPYFQQRVGATGEPQSSTLVNASATERVLAYGEATDRVYEYGRF